MIGASDVGTVQPLVKEGATVAKVGVARGPVCGDAGLMAPVWVWVAEALGGSRSPQVRRRRAWTLMLAAWLG